MGRVVRTIFLLEYISDDALRQVIQAAQNKCEGFNNFAQWDYFESDKIERNMREDQLKIIKYNHLIANLILFHNCHTMTKASKELEAEGMNLIPEISEIRAVNTLLYKTFADIKYKQRDIKKYSKLVLFKDNSLGIKTKRNTYELL